MGRGKTLSCDDFPPDAKYLEEINSCGASELRWQQLKGLGTRLSVSRQKTISMQLLVDSKTATTFPKNWAAVRRFRCFYFFGFRCHCLGAHLLQGSVQMSWSPCSAK